MHDLRQIIEEAKPSVLQLFGFAGASENHLERSARESGLPVEWRMIDESGGALRDLDRMVATALFRIAQEAVNNAIRHAQPGAILVCQRCTDGILSVETDDDGGGMDACADGRGHAIDKMKPRPER